MKLHIVETRGLFAPTHSPLLPEDMRQVGEEAVRQTVSRVRGRGVGSFGQPMPAYSPDYKQARAKKGLQTGYRSLTRTGNFLDSLRVIRPGKSVVTYGWTTQLGKTLAKVHQERSLFLPPTKREVEFLGSILNQKVGSRVRTMVYTRPVLGKIR